MLKYAMFLMGLGSVFCFILGALGCHYQHLFSLVLWCFFDAVFFRFLVEFIRNWGPILLTRTLFFHAFFAPRFLHRFGMDLWCILEPFWLISAPEKVLRSRVRVMIWHYILAFLFQYICSFCLNLFKHFLNFSNAANDLQLCSDLCVLLRRFSMHCICICQ